MAKLMILTVILTGVLINLAESTVLLSHVPTNITGSTVPLTQVHTNITGSNKMRDQEPGGQGLTCYDYTNGGGNSFSPDSSGYVPDLRSYNFDNKISSCCFNGIYILYADNYYNEYNRGGAMWWGYGLNYCVDVPSQFDNQASSVRLSGVADNMRADSLNLYFNDYFIGGEEYTYQDKPFLENDNMARSLIVTGCYPWTLYQYDNYQGSSICVYPSDLSKCDPGMYQTSQTLGNLANQISSVRRGCYSDNKSMPDNFGVNTHDGGAQGCDGGAEGCDGGAEGCDGGAEGYDGGAEGYALF